MENRKTNNTISKDPPKQRQKLLMTLGEFLQQVKKIEKNRLLKLFLEITEDYLKALGDAGDITEEDGWIIWIGKEALSAP